MIAPLDGRRSSGYGPTGALVAAATTSLPETPGGERNWDYRYTWIRDATFMLWGLYTLGFEWEANDFFYFLADVAEAEPDDLQIMYGIGGERELPSRSSGISPATRRAAGADRQRRLRPVPARRVGRDPRFVLPPHEVAGPCRSAPGRSSSSRSSARSSAGGSRTAASGRCAASRGLHVLQADVLGRRRPRRAPRGDSRGPRVRGALAVGRGGDQGRRRAVSASTRRRPGRRRADRLPRQSQGSSAGSATGPPSRPRANGPLRRATTDPVRAPTPMAPRAGPAAVQRRVSA